MVHIKRTTGYLQITLGFVLIFAVLIVHPWIVNEASEQHLSSLGFFSAAEDQGISFDYKEKVDILTSIGSSAITTHYIIICAAAIIIVLAIMMILQGIANTRSGTDDD